ncbi:hypothetical protein IB277_14750 [Ensifer sp. ENS07]|uniref:hypothetical protein n=1 Tax=unclassified Ensifer TaxID=2633371 RepID=UPI0017872B46|nr:MULTISPECIES: hypothetical protein [unclassified Ensifer]MBD9507940.1 hypothetical protein [Ensifer sp. ENS10]MBD9637563.1 hypothetical protein [Ensifer sp. ENS07]
MTRRYIITAEIADREPDGLNPEDGSQVYRMLPSRKTWSVDPTMTIGEIMDKVDRTSNVYRVTITEDSSDQKPW